MVVHLARVAEALVLGVKSGADPNTMLEVITTSFGSSSMLDRGAPMIIERNFGGDTPVDLLRKSSGLIHEITEALGVPHATGSEARRVFDRAHAEHLGSDDITATVRPLDRAAGVEVRPVASNA